MTETATRTTVVNVKRDDYDVRIDRATIWGNPFRIGPDGDREEVIAKYRTYIEGAFLRFHVHLLRGKRLGCHCAPLPCHGDVLAELADRP